MAIRNMPDHNPEPIQSNWVTEPSQAHVEVEVRATLHTEQYLRVTPSLDEIYREMHHEPERNGDGQIVAIGRLHFSDGTQTEKAFTIGPDGDVIQYDRRMPTGAMLGAEERLTDGAGGNAPARVTIGNSTLALRFGVQPVGYIPGGRKRRGTSYTAEQSRALIEQAIANTKTMPEVTRCPPGIANGTAQASDCFIGMKIGSTGKAGAASWVDQFVATQEREIERKAHDEMSTQDKAVLQAALVAGSLAEVGITVGQSPEYARRKGGKHALVAANDNYAINLQKFGS